MFEWPLKAIKYSSLEQKVLKSEELALFSRYKTQIDTKLGKVHAIDAPSYNADKIKVKYTMVFVHGLGGNIDCFETIVKSINQFCEVLLIDLPGNGNSPEPYSTEAFTSPGICEVLEEVIAKLCKTEKFVFLGHSYGTSHVLRLATTKFRDRCGGVICITPPYGKVITPTQRSLLKFTPNLVFDLLFRSKDRVGGLYSASVNRLVSANASEQIREEQMKINLRARTNAVLHTLINIDVYDPSTEPVPECPIMVVCAQNDQVTPPQKCKLLVDGLQGAGNVQFNEIHDAGHAVMFEKHEALCGLMNEFLVSKVDHRLSMTYQLQEIASLEDKWSLKNEQKWMKVVPVGTSVGTSCLKGMKVLREGDELHGPSVFHSLHPEIRYIIDISREAPPYTPERIEGVEYIKFPTVSKVPPTKKEISAFIDLVNKLKPNLGPDESIAVHCHYGYNRTGFFICCYLIQELGYSVGDAIKAYKESREPGIRHEHFINELYFRYNL